MTIQIINIGQTANDRRGDSLRTAFQKINTNFTELYNLLEVTSLTELAQDYAASMFVNGIHQGIDVTYDDANNRLNIVNTRTDISQLTDNQGLLSGLADNIDGGSAITVYEAFNFNVDGGGASVVYGPGEKAINGGGA